MPNRILREGILTSERVNLLDWDAEVFYRRLMSVVDDYGRYTANPKLLRAALYPLQIEKVRDANIAQWLSACVEVGLVRVYAQSGASGDRCGNPDSAIGFDAARSSRKPTASADRSGGDKRFLEMLDFRQQVRAKESKYPQPPSEECLLNVNCTSDAKHLIADAHLDGGEDEDEDEDVKPNPSIARNNPDGKFLMHCEWRPSEHIDAMILRSGLVMPDSNQLETSISEFVLYWITQKRMRTQHEWDHAFIKNLKAEKCNPRSRHQVGNGFGNPLKTRQQTGSHHAHEVEEKA